MQEFLTTIVSFPTIVFSGLLAMVLLYWLVLIFGALDLDFLDSVLGLDSIEGAFDGALESIDGAAESIDGALDGGAEAVDGAAESASDATESGSEGLVGSLLNAMGVRGVPITIVGTFEVFWAWLLSYVGTRLFGAVAASAIIGLAVAITASFGALVLAAITARPFRKLFVTHLAPRRAQLVGKMCTILSGSVDADFGRAEIEDGGAGFVAEVRCMQPNDLVRGAKALVYRYEPSDEVFFIGPVDAALAEADAVADES